MEYLKKILAITFLIWLTSFIWMPLFGRTILLKYIGKCKTAVITNEMTGGRYSNYTLEYLFSIDGKKFSGNSNLIDKSKIGDSICITYLEFMPSINAPTDYYDNSMNCSCNKMKIH